MGRFLEKTDLTSVTTMSPDPWCVSRDPLPVPPLRYQGSTDRRQELLEVKLLQRIISIMSSVFTTLEIISNVGHIGKISDSRYTVVTQEENGKNLSPSPEDDQSDCPNEGN